MNNFLIFLLKSTLSLSLLYLAFSMLMRKETFFKLNRMILLFMVLCSMLIPFLYSPQLFQPIVSVKLEPIFQNATIIEEPVQAKDESVAVQLTQPVKEAVQPVTLSASTIFILVYLLGVFVSFLLLAFSIASVLLLFRKALKTNMNGIRLMIVDEDIPAFSFGRNILISQHDFDTNSEAILTHEQSHIRLGHFYDLILMELIKIVFWFNPLVYRMVSDLKEIHEFQADDHTLSKGIDATKYQILIIQKCVGHQKFALANSFNHCQIKNRITMMNKQKTSKAWRWKVATFLPLLALLLMAFGKTGENVNSGKEISPQIAAIVSQDSVKKMNSTDFTPPPIFIEIQKEGILLVGELMTLDEFRKRMPLVVKHNPRSKFIVSAAGINDSNTQAVKDILKEAGASNIKLTVKYTPPIKQNKDIAPPNPNKYKRYVWLKNNGTLRYDLVYITFDVLAEKVKSDLQNNPKLQFDIMVEEGKIDERVDKITNVLKVNGNPKVRYSSFHEEKETDSNGATLYEISSKVMNIK